MKSTQAIPFIYGVQIVLTASGTGTGTITTNQDAPFELHYYMARTNKDMTATTIGSLTPSYFTAMITDQTTGRQLMSQKIHQEVLTGPANRSISEKRPVVFPPGTVFVVDLTDLGNAATVDFCLKGYKIFTI